MKILVIVGDPCIDQEYDTLDQALDWMDSQFLSFDEDNPQDFDYDDFPAQDYLVLKIDGGIYEELDLAELATDRYQKLLDEEAAKTEGWTKITVNDLEIMVPTGTTREELNEALSIPVASDGEEFVDFDDDELD